MKPRAHHPIRIGTLVSGERLFRAYEKIETEGPFFVTEKKWYPDTWARRITGYYVGYRILRNNTLTYRGGTDDPPTVHIIGSVKAALISRNERSNPDYVLFDSLIIIPTLHDPLTTICPECLCPTQTIDM